MDRMQLQDPPLAVRYRLEGLVPPIGPWFHINFPSFKVIMFMLSILYSFAVVFNIVFLFSASTSKSHLGFQVSGNI